jgi:hypothetical protein
MRTRNLLATVVASTLLAGAAGVVAAPAQATRASSAAAAGSVVAWADTSQPTGVAAATVPTDLTVPAASVATSMGATAVVTTDGRLRVWGTGAEVDEAPTDVTDAVAVTLAAGHGAVLRAEGKIRAWGQTTALANVPTDLRAKAIAVGAGGTGYAVRTDGTLTTWGTALGSPIPVAAEDLTNLVDVSVGLQGQVLALRADGQVFAWGLDPNPASPFNTVPDLGGKKVTQISTGGLSDGVVLEDGTIRVWGVAPVANEPDFAGKKVVSLSIGAGFVPTAGAVTEDGVVHTWGGDPEAGLNTHPVSLAGKPVAAIAMGMFHAAVIVTTLRDLTKPTITGTPQVGQTLTATPATFNLTPDAPATGQWYADGAVIAGKTGTTLALDQSVVGKKISYRSTAARNGTTVTSASNELGPVTAVVAPPVPTAKAKSTVTATVKATGKTKKVAKKVTITVTVKTTKGVSPAGKVKVKLNGKTKKTITVKINAKGQGKAIVKKAKRGKYQAQLSYTGNDKVASSQKTVKFKV